MTYLTYVGIYFAVWWFTGMMIIRKALSECPNGSNAYCNGPDHIFEWPIHPVWKDPVRASGVAILWPLGLFILPLVFIFWAAITSMHAVANYQPNVRSKDVSHD